MSSYGKKKFGCFGYIMFAVAIIFIIAYTFTKTMPKASQTAKEEVLEMVFGASSAQHDTASAKTDSVTIEIKTPGQKIEEPIDTSLAIVPIKVTDNSVYLIAKVNGVDMNFMLDTGCSGVQITSAEYYYMKHLDIVSDDDISGRVTCIYADNSKNDCPTMKLKSINIGGIELKDIDCTIQENGDASLLLGQDVLKKLGEVSIDYKNNKLKIIK